MVVVVVFVGDGGREQAWRAEPEPGRDVCRVAVREEVQQGAEPRPENGVGGARVELGVQLCRLLAVVAGASTSAATPCACSSVSISCSGMFESSAQPR